MTGNDSGQLITTSDSAFVEWAKNPSRTDMTISELSERFQELAANVTNGSIFHFNVLVHCLHQKHALSCHPHIVDLLFLHLQQSPTLDADTMNDEHRTELAEISLAAIHIAIRAHTANGCIQVEGSLLVSKLLLSWPIVWEWIKHLYYWTDHGLDFSFDAESRPLTEVRRMNMINIQGIISCAICASATSLCEIVMSTPGLFLLLMEIWTRQSDRPRDEKSVNDGVFLVLALSKFIMAELTEFDLLADAIHDEPARLAYVMLKPLQLSAYGGQPWCQSYPGHVGIYSAMSRISPRLFNILPTRDAMFAVCHVLAWLSSIPFSSDVIDDCHATCIQSSCHYIRAVVEARDDFMWINSAIHIDLIPSMLRAGLRASDEIIGSLYAVFEFLRVHLCYRTVLRSLAKVMTSPGVATLMSRITRDSKFWTAWGRFSTSAYIDLGYKITFDERGLKYAHKCASPECSAVEALNAESFGLCGKCQYVVYCSKSCQKQHWKSGGHRSICDAVHHSRAEGRLPHISIRDIAFFTFLMDQEIERDRNEIIQQRDDVLRSMAGVCPLILLLDRTLPPPRRFTVSLPSTLNPEMVANNGTWEIEPPAGELVPMMQTYMRVPYGKRRIILKISSKVAGDLFGGIYRRVVPSAQNKEPC
ncbi:hypothetical protein Hypma_001425 [Hypsizygus marmoreus]|uniref:MYND-type domain-containing protein n=1 Tax=Hypsizygus marmoreus TaxID=39966 RepID=A0A369K0J8_HYPMA|nr:hypothetical protein Hypma_001425 [Hypsizygus marmoreus]